MTAGIEGLAGIVAASLRSATGASDAIRRTVEAIKASNPLFHWAGVYLLEGTMLSLAHEIGHPTPHRLIPLDKGICGAAAREGVTIVVDDVHADPRYLACTLRTRSEIVVPLRASGRILGEIDIDSDEPAAFTKGDRAALESVSDLLSAFLDRAAWTDAGSAAPRSGAAAGEGR
ncbi:MAG: GAF domain-containing protein [Acidobacteria bacterium]|nr:GAF domain-containing protein [Acidobacteriota bacterium]